MHAGISALDLAVFSLSMVEDALKGSANVDTVPLCVLSPGEPDAHIHINHLLQGIIHACTHLPGHIRKTVDALVREASEALALLYVDREPALMQRATACLLEALRLCAFAGTFH